MLSGNALPLLSRFIVPCDADGVPAMTPEEIAAARFETRAVVFAWLGLAWTFPFGQVSHRTLDPDDPRRYAPGNVREHLI